MVEIQMKEIQGKVEEVFERYNYREDHSNALKRLKFTYDNEKEFCDEEIWIYRTMWDTQNFIILINYIDAVMYFYRKVNRFYDDLTFHTFRRLESTPVSPIMKKRLEKLGFVKMSKSVWLHPEQYNSHLIRFQEINWLLPEFYYVVEGYDILNRCWPKNILKKIKEITKKKQQTQNTQLSKWMDVK